MDTLERLFMVKISSRGQVVIPKHIRAALDLRKGDELLLVPVKEGILMKRPVKEERGLRGLLKGLDIDTAEWEAILVEAKRSLAKVVE